MWNQLMKKPPLIKVRIVYDCYQIIDITNSRQPFFPFLLDNCIFMSV